LRASFLSGEADAKVVPLSGQAEAGTGMIRIAISDEAFEAIARTLPLGSMGFEAEANERGEKLVWLEDAMADRLAVMRGPGESYSDAIIRIAGQEALATLRG
jgi:hypothetical protein